MTPLVCPFDQHELDDLDYSTEPGLLGVIIFAAYERDGVLAPDFGQGIVARFRICAQCGFVALFKVADPKDGGAEL